MAAESSIRKAVSKCRRNAYGSSAVVTCFRVSALLQSFFAVGRDCGVWGRGSLGCGSWDLGVDIDVDVDVGLAGIIPCRGYGRGGISESAWLVRISWRSLSKRVTTKAYDHLRGPS